MTSSSPPPPFAAPPPLLTLATLTWLHGREDDGMGGDPDAPAAASQRALGAAKAVHAIFTARGTDEAGLGPKMLDFSVLAALDEATGRGGATAGRVERRQTASSSSSSSSSSGDAEAADGEPAAAPHHPPPSIPTLAAATLTYDAFVMDHLEVGRPAIITGIADGWGAKAWTKKKDGKKGGGLLLRPDLDALAAALPPGIHLPVVDGPCREEWPVEKYVAWWREHEAWEASHADTPAAGRPVRRPRPRPRPPLLYAKDFHLPTAAPAAAAAAYVVPPYFADDWLNGAADAERAEGGKKDAIFKGGFRFLYVGPAGTGTPLHTDVLASCSWSVNLAGCKEWAFLEPGAAHLATDRWGRALAGGLEDGGADPDAFPGHGAAVAATTRLAQHPGSALFVPPAWPHTVLNVEAALSLNHNWVNAHTLGWVADALRRERDAAAAAIEDCRPGMSAPEFEATVQAAIASSAGLDYAGFAYLLAWGVRRAARRVGSGVAAALALGGSLFAPLAADDPDTGNEAALSRRIALAASFDARRARRAAGGLLQNVRWPAGRGEGMRKGEKEEGMVDGESDPALFADPLSAAALLVVVQEADAVIEKAAWAREDGGAGVEE